MHDLHLEVVYEGARAGNTKAMSAESVSKEFWGKGANPKTNHSTSDCNGGSEG